MLPYRSGKNRCKNSHDTAKGDRQREHDSPFGMKRTGSSLPIDFDANRGKWTKSSSVSIPRCDGRASGHNCCRLSDSIGEIFYARYFAPTDVTVVALSASG